MVNSYYYNQDNLWGKSTEDYQFQVFNDILTTIPKQINSILDIGCGDGYITNSLPKEIEVVGMDISEAALKYVQREKVVGDILNIPFPDASFDLIMVNDVLEHIPDEDYQKALNELKRVSKKYILITVPLDVDLEPKLTKCADCGHVYHINWHQRIYNENEMCEIEDEDWEIDEIRYSGGITLPPRDPSMKLKHQYGYYLNWQGAVCPKCNSKKQVESNEDSFFYRSINAARHNRWFSDLTFSFNNRSELITLFRLKGIRKKGIRKKCCPKFFKKNPLEIDFSNRLQTVNTDFIPGSNWAKFSLPANGVIDKTGLCNENPEASYLEVPIKLPVIPKKGDLITIRLFAKSWENKLVLHAVDGVSTTPIQLYNNNVKSPLIKIPIDFDWTADKFGLSITLFIHGDIKLIKLRYKKANGFSQMQFLKVNKGHNLLYHKTSSFLRSWGLYANENGVIPAPAWIFTEKVREKEFIDISINEVLNELINSQELLVKKNKTLVKHFTRNKLDDISAKGVLDRLLADVELLNNSNGMLVDFLKKKENEIKREKEENEVKREKEENEIKRRKEEQILNGKKLIHDIKFVNAKKVLVLSHMFPHFEQKILGPFIHEQVKALREYEGIDARVISCRPFWMSGVDFRHLWHDIKSYFKALEEYTWVDYDGVPVMYLPYMVGKPFFPFHLHAFSYRYSLLSVIDKIFKEFNFDIVHSHTSYLDGTAGLSIAKHFKVPFIITEHTGPFTVLTGKPLVKQLTLRAIKKADRVWCVSDSLADEVKSYFHNDEIKKHIKVLYNGVLVEKFYGFQSNHDGPVKLLYVGALEDVKNPENLILAFNRVKKEFPNAILTIVGDGPLRSQVCKLLNKLNLKDSCNLLGLRSRDEVAEIMREECDIFILPSKSETFGVVLLEALACGKPVVATRCGGPESIIVEEYLGELCEKNNPYKLAEAIIKVINRIDSYDSQKIRDYAIKTFDYRVLAKKLASEYMGIITNKNSRKEGN